MSYSSVSVFFFPLFFFYLFSANLSEFSLAFFLCFPSSSLPISFVVQPAGNFSVGDSQMRFTEQRTLVRHPINQRALECAFSNKPYRSTVLRLGFWVSKVANCHKIVRLFRTELELHRRCYISTIPAKEL